MSSSRVLVSCGDSAPPSTKLRMPGTATIPRIPGYRSTNICADSTWTPVAFAKGDRESPDSLDLGRADPVIPDSKPAELTSAFRPNQLCRCIRCDPLGTVQRSSRHSARNYRATGENMCSVRPEDRVHDDRISHVDVAMDATKIVGKLVSGQLPAPNRL
jgi:hypothetical protein